MSNPKTENQIYLIIFIAALAIIIASQALFTVDQREQAIVLQFGEPIGEPRSPGIHVKIPIIQQVKYFDRRVLSVDPQPEQVVISNKTIEEETANESTEATESQEETASTKPSIEDVSGEPVLVDTFAKYRIVDPLQFMKTLRTVDIANSRIKDILKAATRTTLGKTTLQQLLSEERSHVMSEIKQRVNNKIQQDQLGIEIVDVRIVRADFNAKLKTSTVRRMISELQERATETRAKGEEKAKEIKSKAEKERTVLLAEARRDAEIIKGRGDNKAIKIYAEAFNKDKEFYAFLRSMEAYKTTLSNPETRMILSPDSEFFKFFTNK
jgi:membrane protease subunit HflC